MIWIGVDPGKHGGYAIVGESNTAIAYPWDDNRFASIMRDVARRRGSGVEECIVAVEKVGAVHGNGIVSMFNFGKSAGYIEGVLTALCIPYQLVPPGVWKREFGLIGKDKKASVEVCRKLFPEVDLKRTERCRTESDGLAESTLLACYAMRHFGNGEVRK